MVCTAAPANFVGTKSVPMKISFQWLKDLLPVTTSAEDAAAVLTATGLEVEGVETVESIPGGLNGLVVGEITAVPSNIQTPIGCKSAKSMLGRRSCCKSSAERAMRVRA
jgi:hypothetical protein